jgi:hypothetical protein
MKPIRSLYVAATLAVSPCAAADGDLLRDLGGNWQGPGLAISIDAERMQARTDPEHPFRWEPLTILNITGNMVVFRVGEQDFIALVEPGKLTLTTPALAGTHILSRQD